MKLPNYCLPLLSLSLVLCASSASADVTGSLGKIVAVGREGQGNEEASAAWKDLVSTGPEALLPVLNAAGKGNIVADNWLRLAAEVIAEQTLTKKQPLPVAALEAFLNDHHQASPARLLAFDLIQQADPAKAAAIEPGLADDPAQELRRGAVQRRINAGKELADAKKEAEAKTAYQSALDAARDEDQVKVIAEALTKLGEEVNLPKHFGFVTQWQVIGPFDNVGRAGFDKVFPPEKEIKLDTKYPGKDAEVAWQPFETKHEYGKLDFNKPLTMLKDATAYAVATVNSPEDRDAEIRLNCKNGWKVWVNGQFLFGRDEYHRGAQMDQYILKCHLKKGANTILVKCCQNEQKEQWTVEWEFQLRVCDATGTAILASNP
ncbi:MAG: hypothetical protein ACAI34_07655 [Verrucomicrobium sp.]